MRVVWFRRLAVILLAILVLLLWRRQRRVRFVVERRDSTGWRLVGWAVLLGVGVLVLCEWEALRAFVGNVTRFRPGMSTDDAVWVVVTVAILGAVVVLALRLIASGSREEPHRRRRRDERGEVSTPPTVPRQRMVVRPAHTLQSEDSEYREEEHDRPFRSGGGTRGSSRRR